MIKKITIVFFFSYSLLVCFLFGESSLYAAKSWHAEIKNIQSLAKKSERICETLIKKCGQLSKMQCLLKQYDHALIFSRYTHHYEMELYRMKAALDSTMRIVKANKVEDESIRYTEQDLQILEHRFETLSTSFWSDFKALVVNTGLHTQSSQGQILKKRIQEERKKLSLLKKEQDSQKYLLNLLDSLSERIREMEDLLGFMKRTYSPIYANQFTNRINEARQPQ